MDEPVATLDPAQPQQHRARGPRGSAHKRDMPHRRIRLPEELAEAADKLAERQQTSWQEIVRQALTAYVPPELLEEEGVVIAV
jgi:predicted GNAT superfamily acetyltransferase